MSTSSAAIAVARNDGYHSMVHLAAGYPLVPDLDSASSMQDVAGLICQARSLEPFPKGLGSPLASYQLSAFSQEQIADRCWRDMQKINYSAHRFRSLALLRVRRRLGRGILRRKGASGSRQRGGRRRAAPSSWPRGRGGVVPPRLPAPLRRAPSRWFRASVL